MSNKVQILKKLKDRFSNSKAILESTSDLSNTRKDLFLTIFSQSFYKARIEGEMNTKEAYLHALKEANEMVIKGKNIIVEKTGKPKVVINLNSKLIIV